MTQAWIHEGGPKSMTLHLAHHAPRLRYHLTSPSPLFNDSSCPHDMLWKVVVCANNDEKRSPVPGWESPGNIHVCILTLPAKHAYSIRTASLPLADPASQQQR